MRQRKPEAGAEQVGGGGEKVRDTGRKAGNGRERKLKRYEAIDAPK